MHQGTTVTMPGVVCCQPPGIKSVDLGFEASAFLFVGPWVLFWGSSRFFVLGVLVLSLVVVGGILATVRGRRQGKERRAARRKRLVGH